MKSTRTKGAFGPRLNLGMVLLLSLSLVAIHFSSGYAWTILEGYTPGFDNGKFDFVIVGGGNAGMVLANRLSEITGWRILVLEAGFSENVVSDIPVLAANLQSTYLNWGFKYEKQPNTCLGMIGQACPAPRGKALGGSTTINYMIYARGNAADFDAWAALGNPGWSYRDILPYFIKSEKAAFADSNTTPKHGYTGPVNVEYVPYRTPLVDAFVKANKELGRKVLDFNGDSQLGVNYLPATTKLGKRVTSASAYLLPLINRSNLKVLQNAMVTKVIIDPITKTATGVEYTWLSRKYKAYATKEVILSAGAFQSPQILMLSGVGPRAHLTSLGIPVVADLPVGQNMYDHFNFLGLTFLTNTTGSSIDIARFGLTQFIQYSAGTGIFTIPGSIEALAFIRTNGTTEPAGVPDIEFLFLPGSVASDRGTGAVRAINWNSAIYDQMFKPLEGKDHFTVCIMLFHPKSKGTVQLRDTNPMSPPLLNHNFFTQSGDMTTVIAGIKEAIRLVNTPAMKAIGARVNETPVPTCTQFAFGTDAYWECAVRTLGSTLYHPSSTCRMGPANDTNAVVSPTLQVYGVKNLRVVDASIMPYITTGHLQAPVYAIAEKASDMIKKAWGKL